MPQLRWTLLCLGVLFIILLAYIERRRQHRQGFSDYVSTDDKGEGKDPPVPGSAFREPSLALPEMRAREPGPPQELPVVEIEEDSLNARRLEVGEPLMEPPTLSLPVVDSGPVAARGRTEPTMSGALAADKPAREFEVPRLDTPAAKADSIWNRDGAAEDVPVVPAGDSLADRSVARAPFSDEQEFNEAVFGEVPADTTPDEMEATGAGFDTTESGAATEGPDLPTAPLFTAADVTPVVEPIVEWPPEDQRKLVALRLVAPPPDRLAGRALRLALASEGFVLGKFSIFHKPDDNGRAVLSAASLSKPGTFDIETMDLQRYSGLSLFAVLPGPKPPLKAFEDLLTAARNINERLQGALQDERGGPLTPTRIATLRESLGAEPMP